MTTNKNPLSIHTAFLPYSLPSSLPPSLHYSHTQNVMFHNPPPPPFFASRANVPLPPLPSPPFPPSLFLRLDRQHRQGRQQRSSQHDNRRVSAPKGNAIAAGPAAAAAALESPAVGVSFVEVLEQHLGRERGREGRNRTMSDCAPLTI